MSDSSIEVVPCPAELRGEAASLVLSEIAPSQRREIAGNLLDGDSLDAGESSSDALFAAIREGRLIGAVWGQRQPGNTAVLWPPRLLGTADSQVARRLAGAAVSDLDRAGVGMTQVLLPPDDSELVPVLSATGFSHLAELIYLSCEAELFPRQPPVSNELEFARYNPAERCRLIDLVERTYAETLDCVGLNGQRPIEDVIDGYQETGQFCAENWQIVVNSGRDVGVLLLADHPQARHWELMYMGLVPAARGNDWGSQIVRRAQWLAQVAGAERIVLAVDAMNRPALTMYERTGFTSWDRRSVFVRIFR